ncbi:MAG: cytochrome P450 [Novosphingobium sp.]|nr:cytochrome P450 [Novosphingobium sp.]
MNAVRTQTGLRMGGAENASPAAAPELEALAAQVDHYDPLFLANRIEMFRLMHRQDRPIRHSDNHGGFWFVTGYAEAKEIQRRAEDFSNRIKVVPQRPVADLIPSALNPPEHRPVKTALASLFLPRAILGMRRALAESADRLFDECVAKGAFDIVEDLMFPLMAEFTMVHMLGLDPAKALEYAGVVHAQSRPVPDPEHARKVQENIARLGEEFARVYAERRFDPDCVMARIVDLDVDGRRFTIEELVKIAFNLVVGGFGTTATFTASMFVFLGRNPDLRRQIVEDRSLIPSAIDEMLRLLTPVQTFARRVERDTEVGGVTMREGDQLLMGYAAANLDPRVFDEPETVDFRRSPNVMMSFGIGPHRCLGEHVARAILVEVLNRMADRMPGYTLDEAGVVPHGLTSSMWGYAAVKVRV